MAGELDEASALYEDLLCRHPNDAHVLFGLATIFSQSGRYGIAIALFLQTVTLDPKNAEAFANLGVCLRASGHEKSALEAYRESLKINPSSAETISNIAGLYVNAGEPGLCLEWAERALKINPESPQAGNHKALALLEMGKLADGWKWYESRFRLPTFHTRRFDCPKWTGWPNVDGKTVEVLAIHGEQGLGDEILFLSCLNQTRAMVKKVVVECAERLIPIFSRSFPDVRFYPTHEALIAAERPTAWTAMGSLPGFFRADVDSFRHGKAYLKADDDMIAQFGKLLPENRPVIGVAWRGGTRETHANTRTTQLLQWAPILANDCTFVSLQYSDREIGDYPCVTKWDHGNDIDRLSAMAMNCDLVISMDQTLVHQCGALGVPCWTLVPKKPSWRYGLSGPMLWYQSVTLYRQTTNWADLIRIIAGDLENYIADYGRIQKTQFAVA